MPQKKNNSPKILVLDVETAPMTAFVWGTFDQNIPLNMIQDDWHLLSWSAKWIGDAPSKIMYMDQRKAKDITNDKNILEGIWKLMDEADVIVGQNSKKFDIKKLNARFILNGMKPPSSFKQIDTLVLARKHFAFTSNKLEFLSENLCTKYKKLKHGKFPGFQLWKECLSGNQEAWKEMQKYNCHDVLATEELYLKLVSWDKDINFDAYTDDLNHTCACGCKKFRNKGYAYTSAGKFHRYQCVDCNKESRGKVNLLVKEKRQSMRR
jgi:hypothetical protein